jgi:beta-glucanase (GH16 family)
VVDGVRPAFWFVGANIDEVGWPACGELDVLETSQRDASTVRQTMHFPRTSDLREDVPYGPEAPGGLTQLDTPVDDAFHRYGVYFDDEVVQFFVDGQARLTLTRQEAWERGRTWPFGQPQYAILNIALGPDVDPTSLPVSMEISELAIWEGGVPPSPVGITGG